MLTDTSGVGLIGTGDSCVGVYGSAVRRLLSLAVVLLMLVTSLGFAGRAEAAPWIPCGSGARLTVDPINYNLGTGMSGSSLATKHVDGLSIAVWNWAALTVIDFGSGGLLTWERYSRGAEGPYAEHFPEWVDYSTCRLVTSTIAFNSYYTNAWTKESIANTAAHEIGHRVGFAHEPNDNPCNPLTIMLPTKFNRWNGYCYWTAPQDVDRWIVNATYT